ncbi:MAG: heparinase II/III family protein [Sulfolobales archaeon]
MKLYSLKNDEISVEIDLETGVVTQITDLVKNVRHLFSRRPELETRKPGMGVLILEPYFCENPHREFLSTNEILFECRDRNPVLRWRVGLEEDRVRYSVELVNKSEESVKSRIRIAIHTACGRGGFWGDPEVEGATYSCRYYVSYGFDGRRDTFSSIMTPGGVREYHFEKHSYKTRFFPEVKWIATIDRVLRVGILISVLRGDVYAATEDQFFNTEINIISLEREIPPRSTLSVELEILPLRDLARVDYVSRELIVSIESPSIAIPGEVYSGFVRVYSLKDLDCSIRGFIEYDKNMSSIGRRGYCIDQVRPSVRTQELVLEKNTLTTRRGELWESSFRSRDPVEFSMDRELYEYPSVVLELCGERHVVKRYFTIQPEASVVLGRVPENLRDKLYNKYIYDNIYVESEYNDAIALKDLYTYISKPPTLRKILRERLEEISVSKDLADLIVKYLSRKSVRDIISRALKDDYNKILLLNVNPLDLVFLYLVERERVYLDLLKKIFTTLSTHWFSEDLVGYYTAIHGGAGASRFLYYALSLDLADSIFDEKSKNEIAYALNEIGREIFKITNVWAGNWEFSEAAGLLAISEKIDSADSSIFREKALTVLKTLQYTFLEDGGSVELAAGYHHYDLESIINGAEILYYSGDDSLYKLTLGGGEPLIKRSLLWLWSIATPYNTTPALEDTNEGPIPPDLFIIGFIRYRDPVLGFISKRLWSTNETINNPMTILAMILSRVNPLREEFKSYTRERITRLDSSGRLVYRESEDPESFYVVIDYGPHGAWHGHPDKLSFEVYWRREALIVDAGSGGYYNPLHWTWHRKSIAHNTVTREEEDHLETRGFLRELVAYEKGFKAVLESRIYDNVNLIREFSYRDLVSVKEISIKDTIEGTGLFRWNIHVKGECSEREDRVLCETNKTLIELIPREENVKWFIERRLRGFNEYTSYVYRVKRVEMRDVFTTRIIIKAK